MNSRNYQLDIYPLLSSIFDLAGFSSQVPVVDDFLLNNAKLADDELRSQTSLMVNGSNLVGFYTSSVRTFRLEAPDFAPLKAERILTDAELDSMTQGDVIDLPAVDLSYFAIDWHYQRQGFGTLMMTNFLKNVAEAYIDHGIGFSGVVLFALNEAVPFYQKVGFRALHGIDYENTPDLKQYPMFMNSRFLTDLYARL